MRDRRRSPLFSAVVLAGASLTQAVGGCGGEAEPAPTGTGDASSAGSSSDAGASDGKSPFNPTDAGGPKDGGTCPDGSDRRTPPCALIK